jgi:hypothetical protein
MGKDAKKPTDSGKDFARELLEFCDQFSTNILLPILVIMTIVEGQIESLKKLREILNQNGITRFNSVGDINSFLENYDSEKEDIAKQVEHQLELEIEGLQSALVRFQQSYDELKDQCNVALNHEISYLKERLYLLRQPNNSFKKFIFWPLILMLNFKISNREKNFEKLIRKRTYVAEQEVVRTKKRLEYCIENKDEIIAERSAPRHKELAFAKRVVEGLYPLIAGAIGEKLVVKELQKLSDSCVLFNDYSLQFDAPIYNRSEDDRIYSIQIDHLLVTNAGIFVLETKNWSKKSIDSLSLRSPVEQIKRTSFALFVLLNSDSEYNDMHLSHHHWGDKKIPIRNVIVMIHQKPKEEFKFVKVATLNELNGYISYFDAIFNDEEVKSISNYLRMGLRD